MYARGLLAALVLLGIMLLVACDIAIAPRAPGFHTEGCARIAPAHQPATGAPGYSVGKVYHPRLIGVGSAMHIMACDTGDSLFDVLFVKPAEGIVGAHDPVPVVA